MQLPEDKQSAYDAIMRGENVFITGVAGTGKSFLLDYIRENSGKNLSVTATTGVAAVNVGGQTIHSWAGVGLARGSKKEVNAKLTQKGKKRIKKCDVLVIDEISMMSNDLFSKLDYCFQQTRRSNDPFGGVQLIVFGDFLQLPPVSRNNEDIFCFQAESWKECGFVAVELTKVYRQNDEKFIRLLNNIRVGEYAEEDLEVLSKCIFSPDKIPEGLKPIVLTSKNARCDELNEKQLAKIDAKPKRFTLRSDGDPYKVQRLVRDAQVVEELDLKPGTQVLLTINLDQKSGLVNGSLGKVKKFSKESGMPVVEFDNGVTREIDFNQWETNEYDPDAGEFIPVAWASQVPLKLAWAITIHKSQGKTLSYVYIELQDVFMEAQVYVSLSRARNLEGLFLAGFDPSKIRVNETAKYFYDNIDEYCTTPKTLI